MAEIRFPTLLRTTCWIVLAVALPWVSARSQTAQDITKCGTVDRASADPQIQACTRLIQSGGLRGVQLARAYGLRGYAHFYFSSEYDLAIQDLSDAIRLNPNDSTAFYVRGDAYKLKAAQSNGDDARRLAALALSDFSENIRLKAHPTPLDYINQSNAFTILGQHEQGLVALNEALRLDPSDKQSALVNRCGIKLMLGRLPEALADCDEAVARRPSDYALSTRALVYLRMGNYARTILDGDAALLCETAAHYQAMALYARGMAKLERGDMSGGDADMAAAKQLLPTVAQQIARYDVR